MTLTNKEFFETFAAHPWPSEEIVDNERGHLRGTRLDLGDNHVTLKFYSYGKEKLRAFPRLRTFHTVHGRHVRTNGDHITQLRAALDAAGYREIIL